MMRWREFAVIAILTMLPGGLALAQDTEPVSPSKFQEEPPMEVPPSVPHVTNHGFVVPAGWNLGVAVDALGVYDSNPAFLTQPVDDVAQRYSGSVSLSYLSKHTVYQAAYLPSLTYYREFASLNSNEQSLSQTLWHDVSPRTSLGWRMDARKYPSWGGSAFADSSFGALLMQLSGLTGLDLRSNVSTASTGFTLENKLDRRSHIRLDIQGGVSKYAHSDSNQFLSLLTAPDSSTWSGQIGLAYDHQLSAHRSLGVGVSSSYFQFTSQNYHSMTQSAQLRYSEIRRDGWIYSVAVGPELREEQSSSSGIEPGLSFSFDVGHKTQKSVFRSSVVRAYQIGQAQGNLTSWGASFSLEHAIGRRCFVGAFGTYQRSESKVDAGVLGTGATQTIAPAVDGGVRLGRHIVWFANYGFSSQKGVLTLEKIINRQQIVTGLSFNVDSLLQR